VIPQILPDCVYDYRVGSEEAFSEILHFHGRSAKLNSAASPRLALVADFGTGPCGTAVLNALWQDANRSSFDAVLHVGDIAYDLDSANGARGDEFLTMIQPVSSQMPYMTLPGNHEMANNFSHYKQRFHMPVNEANEGTNYFYSFNAGDAHFIMLSTEVYFFGDSACQETQFNWLIKDLEIANMNRDFRPWIVVLSHRPFYCSTNWKRTLISSEKSCNFEAEYIRSKLEDVFMKYGVDLYIQAHVHEYERVGPVYKNKTVKSDFDGQNTHVGAKAPIYITNGVGGSWEGNTYNGIYPLDWVYFWSREFGYGKLEVKNKTHLYYEQVGVETGKVIDYVWLEKGRNENIEA
jgi:acid phosphatase type 7